MRVRRIKDPMHGVVTIVEHKHGMMMTNAKPDTQGRWIKQGNTYRYVAFSKKQKGKLQRLYP